MFKKRVVICIFLSYTVYLMFIQKLFLKVEYIHPDVELVEPVEEPVDDVSNAVDEFGVSGSEVAEPQIGGEETKAAKERRQLNNCAK